MTKDEELRRANDTRESLGTPSLRRKFLDDLDRAGLFWPPPVSEQKVDAMLLAHVEGRRSVALEQLRDAQTFAPEQYGLALLERAERLKAKNGRQEPQENDK